jgi:hypothetical protein
MKMERAVLRRRDVIMAMPRFSTSRNTLAVARHPRLAAVRGPAPFAAGSILLLWTNRTLQRRGLDATRRRFMRPWKHAERVADVAEGAAPPRILDEIAFGDGGATHQTHVWTKLFGVRTPPERRPRSTCAVRTPHVRQAVRSASSGVSAADADGMGRARG